jgi:hypothetical protein
MMMLLPLLHSVFALVAATILIIKVPQNAALASGGPVHLARCR